MAFCQVPSRRSQRLRRRRAFTLVELLVVVAMLIIVVSVLTTAMQPVVAGREIREAARQLNAFIAGSVARAAENGRPAGIWIERSAAKSNAAFDIFFAEVPPLYAGDAVSSTAQFQSATQVQLQQASLATVADFIRQGDRIRFNYAGPWYEITAVTPGPPPTVTFTLANNAANQKPPPPYSTGDNVPFQIERGPRKSPVSPMQMPSNTAIDLAHSGVGTSGPQFNSAQPNPVIMFAPGGSVDRVYLHNGTAFGPQHVLKTIHLLVGRPDQVGQTPGNLGTEPNDNRWISINAQTGRVITTENMGAVDRDSDGDVMDDARQFAVSGQGMGG